MICLVVVISLYYGSRFRWNPRVGLIVKMVIYNSQRKKELDKVESDSTLSLTDSTIPSKVSYRKQPLLTTSTAPVLSHEKQLERDKGKRELWLL